MIRAFSFSIIVEALDADGSDSLEELESHDIFLLIRFRRYEHSVNITQIEQLFIEKSNALAER